MKADIQAILSDRDRYVDSMLSTFESHLREILARAQVVVQSRLQRRLAMTNGRIDRTPANMRALRAIDAMFMQAMDEAGYSRLVEAFVGEFPHQLPYIHSILEGLSSTMRDPFPPVVLSAKERAVLSAQQIGTVDQIGSVVRFGAAVAKQRVLMSIGGIGFEDLATVLQAQGDISIARARTLADTAMNVWYRTATDQSFGAIQKDLPEMTLKYEYAGPDDAKTRPFCDHLMQLGRAYTREQIERMNNDQIPNVFLTCGGWNCRHSWLLSVRELEQERKKAA